MTVSTQDLALINQWIYDKESNPEQELPPSYESIEINNQAILHGDWGYATALVRNISTGEIIQVHRGTDLSIPGIFPDGITDVVLSTGISLQQDSANSISTNQIIPKLSELGYSPTNLTQTGHSLGGVFAVTQGFLYNQATEVFNPAGASILLMAMGIDPNVYKPDLKIHIVVTDGIPFLLPQAGLETNIIYHSPTSSFTSKSFYIEKVAS